SRQIGGGMRAAQSMMQAGCSLEGDTGIPAAPQETDYLTWLGKVVGGDASGPDLCAPTAMRHYLDDARRVVRRRNLDVGLESAGSRLQGRSHARGAGWPELDGIDHRPATSAAVELID